MTKLEIPTLESKITDFDFVNVMLHANFQMLVMFVEHIRGHDIIDWEGSGLGKERKEMDRLYCWWTEERPSRVELAEKYKDKEPDDYIKYIKSGGMTEMVFNDEKYPEWAKIVEETIAQRERWEIEDQTNLESLVKMRNVLWC